MPPVILWNMFEKLSIKYESFPLDHKTTAIFLEGDVLKYTIKGSVFSGPIDTESEIKDKDRFFTELEKLDLCSFNGSPCLMVDGSCWNIEYKEQGKEPKRIFLSNTPEFDNGKIIENEEFQKLKEFLSSFGIHI